MRRLKATCSRRTGESAVGSRFQPVDFGKAEVHGSCKGRRFLQRVPPLLVGGRGYCFLVYMCKYGLGVCMCVRWNMVQLWEWLLTAK